MTTGFHPTAGSMGQDWHSEADCARRAIQLTGLFSITYQGLRSTSNR